MKEQFRIISAKQHFKVNQDKRLVKENKINKKTFTND